MKRYIILALFLTGCVRCPTATSERAPAPQIVDSVTPHDVVKMDEVDAPPPTITLPKKVAARNVLIIGDSEACAVAPVAKEVAREWAEKKGYPIDNVAVECKGGTVIQYWAAGQHAKLALGTHPKTDTLLVFLGTNHYWQKTLVGDPTQILDLVKANKLQCTWVGNVAVKGKKWAVNDQVKQAVTPTCNYFDSEEEQIKLHDGVHPDRANAKKWLSDVWETIPLKY